MSFAGHVFDMIARMKANERRKRKPFDREIEVHGQQVRAEYIKPASEEELAAIRQKIQHERRKEFRRLLILGCIALLFIIAILWTFQ